MSFRRNTGNRALSTLWFAPRTVGTWLHAVEDAAKTAIYWVLDPVEWLGKTAKDIKTAINDACTKWRWYQKLRKAPASLIASPLMLLEWVWETLWHTWCNLFRNIRRTIANPFINIWHWIQRVWAKTRAWDFKFEKINKETSVSPKMKLASLFNYRAPTPAPTPTP